jgi:hypothetical protein
MLMQAEKNEFESKEPKVRETGDEDSDDHGGCSSSRLKSLHVKAFESDFE